MGLHTRWAVSIVCLWAVHACRGSDSPKFVPRKKKLIETGWDMPDTRRLRANLAEMEKRPFDGVVLQVIGRQDDEKKCLLRWAFRNEKWERRWFQSAVDDLKACEFTSFTDNFIVFTANPGSVDWFDDAGWANIVDHWRIAAWVARESGVKGLLFDPEPYAPPHRQFSYASQPGVGAHTFGEYWRKARQRGHEVMTAVASECDDLTIFCYFMNSVVRWPLNQARTGLALKSSGYGLFPPFIDGWLDVLPGGITLVDGCESAYRYNADRDYLESAVFIRGDAQNVVSPANRAKYRAQVQVSYGVYLDAYWNPGSSPWYIDGLGGPRVARLRANVGRALECADEYVWVYGEKYRWWPTDSTRVGGETWPEALPGCENVLRYLRDPLDYGRTEMQRLEQAGADTNRVRNGGFGAEAADANGRPTEWGVWQDSGSEGAFALDPDVGRAAKGSARAAKAKNGCFIQAHDARPGERYAVRGFVRTVGEGRAWLRIRWQTRESAWTATSRDRRVYADGPSKEWAELFDVVEVPEGAGKLVVLLLVGDQPAHEDIAWFDDIQLCRLE